MNGHFFSSLDKSLTRLQFFIITFAVALLVSAPLLSSGIHYQDDNFRLITGNVDFWSKNGRPLAVWLAYLLQFSSVISDTSPFSLVIGLMTLAALLALSMERLTRVSSTQALLLSLVVMLSPFMVQAMLYAYDALAILLSIGLGFLGCMALSDRRLFQYGFSFLIFLAAACLYQTAVNHSFILIALGLVLAIDRHPGGADKQLAPACLSLAGLFTALVIYRVLIVPYCVTDSYNMARAATVPVNLQGAKQVMGNALKGVEVLREAFPGYAGVPVMLIFLAGTCGCWKIAVKQLVARPRHWLNYPKAAFCFTAPMFVCAAIAGFLLILNAVSLDPRVLTAFSTALVFNVCIAHKAWPGLKRPLTVLLLAYLLFSATFMLAAFRAAVNQSHFDNGLAISIRNDLSHMDGERIHLVSIIGASPLAPATQPAFRNYPMLKKIISPALSENGLFGYYALMNKFMVLYPLGLTTPTLTAYVPPAVSASNCIYRLYRYKKGAVLDFTTPSCTLLAEPFDSKLADPDDL
ncbi:glucosyltransferase domain-containing protein [Pseudomonas sp. RIT-PI-S]|uniref:glucosyltransferase domain-containing protein n=1 Tax=Pseudomonas sp. RIT-PI-S TaxID=3035295 RepID=UPI0021D813F0|nr:glucosyltransferase domain-containing protein [Pseudomonas sp. RIT-PI-S]